MAGLIAVLCGVAAAALISAIAILIAMQLDGDAMQVFTIGGATFGFCLTLEVALAGLFLAVRHQSR